MLAGIARTAEIALTVIGIGSTGADPPFLAATKSPECYNPSPEGVKLEAVSAVAKDLRRAIPKDWSEV